MHKAPRGGIVSLDQVKVDESAVIGHVAFEAIRERCPALGREPGSVVHCVASRE